MPVSADTLAGSSRDINLAKTAQVALHEELQVLDHEGRGATEGELARIEALAARVGKERHPDIETRGAYAVVWSQIVSEFDFTQDPSERQRIALDVACFELAYPDFSEK